MKSPESSLQSHSSMLLIDDDVLGVICELLDTPAGGVTKDADRNKDALVKKSSLDSLSRTCKRLRAHCLPHLFSNFTLHCCAQDGFWQQAMAKLKDWNLEYSSYVREVSIHLKRTMTIIPPPDDFVEELPDMLASILSRISSSSSRLSKMTFNVERAQVHLFKDAFSRHGQPSIASTGLLFPTVTHLTVGPYNEFIVQHCSNIRHLLGVPYNVWQGQIGDVRVHVMNLIEEAQKIENLESFVVRETLTGDLMNALYSSIPRIKTLAILRHCIFHMSFEDFVSIHLSRFRHLRMLCIPDVSNLGVGYNPPRWGLVKYRPDADEILKRMNEEGKQARERVARAIFDTCPWLKELWFEDRVRVSVGTGVARELEFESIQNCLDLDIGVQ